MEENISLNEDNKVMEEQQNEASQQLMETVDTNPEIPHRKKAAQKRVHKASTDIGKLKRDRKPLLKIEESSLIVKRNDKENNPTYYEVVFFPSNCLHLQIMD